MLTSHLPLTGHGARWSGVSRAQPQPSEKRHGSRARRRPTMTAQAATQLSKAVHITSHTRVVCGSAARRREAGRVQIACVVFCGWVSVACPRPRPSTIGSQWKEGRRGEVGHPIHDAEKNCCLVCLVPSRILANFLPWIHAACWAARQGGLCAGKPNGAGPRWMASSPTLSRR